VKRDLGPDQLLNLVLGLAVARAGALVIVFVIVVIPAPAPLSVCLVGRACAVRFLNIGECEDCFAACLVRGVAQQGCPAGVVALQPGPGQRARGVLVVQEIDKAARRIDGGPL